MAENNNMDLKKLGRSLTQYFSDLANEQRLKKLERMKSSVSFYNRVYEKYRLNFEPDPTLKEKSDGFWSNLLPSTQVSDAAIAYQRVSGISDEKFIHDGIFYAICDSFFNNGEFAKQFDNKAYYPLLFHDVAQPKTVAVRMNNLWLNKDYRSISIDTVLELCTQEDCLVMKYARGACGGSGIRFFSSENLEELKEELISSKLDLVIQSVQSQHKALREIHPSSLNTVRIMTLFLDGGAVMLSSVLRMGMNGSRVDNASAGGIVCGISSQGYTKAIAYDKYGKCYTQHPSGTAFANILIPGFADCVNQSVSLQERFPYCRMISWDWAISENGTPILIEANLSDGELEFHQFCNGPIFGDLTERVMKEALHYCMM